MNFQQFADFFKGLEPYMFHVQCVSPRRYSDFFSLRPFLYWRDVGTENCPDEEQKAVLLFSNFDDSLEVFIEEDEFERITIVGGGASFVFIEADGSIVYVTAYAISGVPVHGYFYFKEEGEK